MRFFRSSFSLATMLDVLLVVLYAGCRLEPLVFGPRLPSCRLGRLFSLICCLDPMMGDCAPSLESLLEEDWS